MSSLLNTLFQRLQEAGFSAPEAAAYWEEVHALASPIMFSFSALRQEPRLRAVAAAHPLLATKILDVQTPSQWQEYCAQMPVHMHLVQDQVCQRWSDCEHALRDYWPLLAMDEGMEDYARRTTMGHGLDAEMPVEGWPALLAAIHRRHALDVLCGQVQLPSHPTVRSWQRVLTMTGLRSVRWSYGDEPGDPRHQMMLMQALLHAQELLRGGVGWRGPLLGLAGSTSLALTDRGSSDGMVQPDPGGEGQTMTLGHWSVLAHEWMHALDIRLARHFKCKQTWATHAALAWEEVAEPPDALMAWFWQIGRILGAAPADDCMPSIRAELLDWEGRFRATLGNSLAVQEEIARQKVRMSQGLWSLEDAEEGWLRILDGHDLVLQYRTAHLLACDVGFVRSVEAGESVGYWAEYVGWVRAQLSDRAPASAMLPAPGEDAHHPVLRSSASLRYLTNAVEVMARSFEVSLSGEHPDAVWLPPSHRPNAGLLWPTQSEARWQGQGWQHTLARLRPLWKAWKTPYKPLHPGAKPQGGCGETDQRSD